MATQTALAYIGGALERLAAADVLGVGAGVTAQGTNAPFALDATGSGAINVGAGAGTGVVNIGTGAGMGALALSRAGINTAIAGLLSVVGAATFTGAINANGGVQRSASGVLSMGTDANTTGLTIGRTGITATVAGSVQIDENLTVTGTETITGAQTFTGLLTVTSASGSGAASAFGAEEAKIQTTEPATAGATVRNPGYVDWEGRTWETTGPSSTTQRYGGFGAVIDSITAASGAISGMTYRWWNAARSAFVLSVNNVGNLEAAGSLAMKNAGANAMTLVPSADVAVTITIPAATDTLVNLAGTQTLSGKTLTSPTINTPALTLETGTSTVAARLAYSVGFLRLGDGTVSRVLVSEDNTQTLTNKTLTAPIINSATTGGTLVSNPADVTIDLTGAATRTLELINSTATQVADFRADGVLKFRNNTAFSMALAGTPTADRTITFPDATGTVDLIGLAQTISARKSYTATLALADGTAVEGLGHGGWTADATAGQQVLVGDAVTGSTTASTVKITDATTSGTDATATCWGVWDGTDVVSIGTVAANFVTGLTLAVNEKCYLSPGSGVKRGCLTNVAPSTTDEKSTVVGYIVNTTGRALYAGATAEPVAEGTAWPDALSARVFVIAGRAPVKV